jgi:hypothetical protein
LAAWAPSRADYGTRRRVGRLLLAWRWWHCWIPQRNAAACAQRWGAQGGLAGTIHFRASHGTSCSTKGRYPSPPSEVAGDPRADARDVVEDFVDRVEVIIALKH